MTTIVENVSLFLFLACYYYWLCVCLCVRFCIRFLLLLAVFRHGSFIHIANTMKGKNEHTKIRICSISQAHAKLKFHCPRILTRLFPLFSIPYNFALNTCFAHFELASQKVCSSLRARKSLIGLK